MLTLYLCINIYLCIKSVNVVFIHTLTLLIYQIMLFLNNKLDRMNMFDFIHETHFILCYVCIIPVSSAHHPLFTSTPIVSEPLPSVSLNYYFVRRLWNVLLVSKSYSSSQTKSLIIFSAKIQIRSHNKSIFLIKNLPNFKRNNKKQLSTFKILSPIM